MVDRAAHILRLSIVRPPTVLEKRVKEKRRKKERGDSDERVE